MAEIASRRVAVVGATGVAGQQFLASLDGHPSFEVVSLSASSRSAGKRFRDAITDAAGHMRWACEEPLPAAFADMLVTDASQLDLEGIDLVFSAVESDAPRDFQRSR